MVELVRVSGGRLRQQDRELVPADAAGDVGRADDVLDALGGLGQHCVAGEVADPVVDRLEVVEVEDDQRQAPPIAVRAGDLACQRLVEVAPVVESREGVEVGQLLGLAEAAGVLDRRPGPLRELFELADLVLGIAVLGRAAVDAQEPDRPGLAGNRHGEA